MFPSQYCCFFTKKNPEALFSGTCWRIDLKHSHPSWPDFKAPPEILSHQASAAPFLQTVKSAPLLACSRMNDASAWLFYSQLIFLFLLSFFPPLPPPPSAFLFKWTILYSSVIREFLKLYFPHYQRGLRLKKPMVPPQSLILVSSNTSRLLQTCSCNSTQPSFHQVSDGFLGSLFCILRACHILASLSGKGYWFI